MTDAARERLFGGALALAQPARTEKRYRVNVDALLLAAFAAQLTPGATPKRPARRAFDLGAGVGAVGLSLLFLEAAASVGFVEVDERLARLAAENLDANGWTARGEVFTDDVEATARLHQGEADLVVCNPPYVEPGRGRAPLATRARARTGSRAAFIAAARTLLGRRGRACFVYPVVDAVSFLGELREAGLEPKRLAYVHAAPVSPARVLLVEALPAKPGGLVVEPALVERGGDDFLARLVRGEISPSSAAGRARSRTPSARSGG